MHTKYEPDKLLIKKIRSNTILSIYCIYTKMLTDTHTDYHAGISLEALLADDLKRRTRNFKELITKNIK